MLTLFIAGIALFLVHRLFNDGAPNGIPRVGKPGAIGYIMTALKFTINTEQVMNEGSQMFGDHPFAVPTLSGWVIILGKDHVDTLRLSNDTIFNQPIAVNETLQLDHTMNPKQQAYPFQATVTRNEVTKGIASFIPEVLDETVLAMEETFRVPAGSEFVSLPLFHSMTHMVGRISNRAMLGLELCRNAEFIHAVVNFAETLVIYAQLLNWTPVILRSLVYFVLSSVWGGPKQPTSFIKPYLSKRLQEREVSLAQPFNISEFLLKNAPSDESLDDLAMRVLNLNFGSIHTSSIFISQALFEMAQMSPQDIDSIRTEVEQVLSQEGGWNKAALNKFRKIDSILREVGRVYGLGMLGMGRLTLGEGQLPDGTVIPPGYVVAINLRAVHFDPKVYPDPQVFDPFRFSKLRQDEDASVKYGFTTVDPHYLPFSAGRHACPGRFFASMELKIMLAHLLLNYDFRLPEGQKERPKSVILAGAVIPPTGHLLFKPRSERKMVD